MQSSFGVRPTRVRSGCCNSSSLHYSTSRPGRYNLPGRLFFRALWGARVLESVANITNNIGFSRTPLRRPLQHLFCPVPARGRARWRLALTPAGFVPAGEAALPRCRVARPGRPPSSGGHTRTRFSDKAETKFHVFFPSLFNTTYRGLSEAPVRFLGILF